MKTQFARIQVQNGFCTRCKSLIAAKLSEIEHVSNIQLFAKESLVVFNFFRANELSDVLNVLSEIGHPEIGERIASPFQLSSKVCSC